MGMGMDTDGWRENTRTSYNNIADSYADLTRRLLDETPEERAVLASFADLVQAQGGGPVVDVGCGTGRITAHLRQLGVDVLRPGGPLLLGFHVGDESHLLTQGYGGRPMNLYVHRRQHSQMHAWLEDAGFVIDTYRTLSSAESKLGGIILAHRRVADPEDDNTVLRHSTEPVPVGTARPPDRIPGASRICEPTSV